MADIIYAKFKLKTLEFLYASRNELQAAQNEVVICFDVDEIGRNSLPIDNVVLGRRQFLDVCEIARKQDVANATARLADEVRIMNALGIQNLLDTEQFKDAVSGKATDGTPSTLNISAIRKILREKDYPKLK